MIKIFEVFHYSLPLTERGLVSADTLAGVLGVNKYAIFNVASSKKMDLLTQKTWEERFKSDSTGRWLYSISEVAFIIVLLNLIPSQETVRVFFQLRSLWALAKVERCGLFKESNLETSNRYAYSVLHILNKEIL